jgi:hypothetical protein
MDDRTVGQPGRSLRILLAIAASVGLLSPPQAYAVNACSPAYKQWTQTAAAVPAAASAPAHDTAFSPVPGRSRTYLTQGSELFTYYNQNYPLGCSPGTGTNPCAPTGGTCTRLKGCKLAPWTASPPSTLSNFPNPVPSSQDPTRLYIFQAAEDGSVYKIDATGEPPYPTSSVDTRRPSCAADKVLATPAVQLYNDSNTAFRNDVDSYPGHAQDDVVFVVTATGCGDLTRNRIIAYWASDLTKKWEFNAPRLPGEEAGPIRVGAGSDACFVDYAANRLYCGTDAPSGSTQDSLWAVRTGDGGLIWSDHPGGGVLARPTLNPNNNKLYVVSRPGSLWAYNPAGDGLGGPSKAWSTALAVASPGAIVTHSPWVEPRPGTWQDKILVLDSAGTLRAIQDNGSTGSHLWVIGSGEPGVRWVSTPVVLPGLTESKAFVGRDDGHLQQIQLDGGQPEGVIQIAALTTEDVFDPVIDTDPVSGHAVVVAGGTRVARVSVPICTTPPGPGASVCFDECFLPANWDPYCVDASCRTPSCRDPGFNPQYNPCQALVSPTSACLGSDYPDCLFGGFGCTSQGDVPDGTACDDGWPGSQGSFANKGASTCRGDAIPAPVACSLPEGADCDPLGLPRHKCVTKPSVCGGVGGGKCCVCNDGYGMNCNDRCDQGQCTSDLFVGCSSGVDSACIGAGDRACEAGTTCCGSDKGGACTSDAGCTTSPQGTCRDLDPLDGDPTRSCYYQHCVDLLDDPQHCGACGNDCGQYTISDTFCDDDLDCGTCFTDAECAFAGGKCVDGACGKCRGDRGVTGQPPCGAFCVDDSQCGGDRCTNGFCCSAGTECVGGAGGSCQPLVCHRLTNRGTCAGGVCGQGAPCIGPDLSTLGMAGQPGQCALDFEFTTEPDGSSLCRAYATNYRTDGGAALARIDESGAIDAYLSFDPTRLNGVSVPRSGAEILAAMVNSGGGGIPGLALADAGGSTYNRVKAATPTGGADDNPFDQAAFNTGPVGPALDYVTYTDGASWKAWFGNFQCPPTPPDGVCTCVDSGLCAVAFQPVTGWSATPEPYCNQPCLDPDGRCDYSSTSFCPGPPERITAIAFEQRPALSTGLYHRHVSVAHGTTVSFVDLDAPGPLRQADVNLASAYVCAPDPAKGGSPVEAILSIAVVPYGDLVVEVRGSAAKNTWLINLSAHDQSCRHQRDVQRSLKHVNPCGEGSGCPPGFSCVEQACMKTCGSCPGGFTCVGGVCRIEPEVPPNFGIGAGSNGPNGRLAILPSGSLLRWTVATDVQPSNWREYSLTASGVGAVECSDGDRCTTDFYDALGDQCAHVPLDCNDDVACTADSCDPQSGACLHVPILVTEPGSLEFVSSATMQWSPTPDAFHWNVYRGTIPAAMLGSRPPGAEYDQVCYESADALGDGPTTSTDVSMPAGGTALYYLSSGEAECESGIGRASSGASIPNAAACPTPP